MDVGFIVSPSLLVYHLPTDPCIILHIAKAYDLPPPLKSTHHKCQFWLPPQIIFYLKQNEEYNFLLQKMFISYLAKSHITYLFAFPQKISDQSPFIPQTNTSLLLR